MRRGAFSLICAVAAAFWVASCGTQDQPMAPESGGQPQLSRTFLGDALTTADRTPEVSSTGMIFFETEAERKEAEARYGNPDLPQTPKPASERRFDVRTRDEVSGAPQPLAPPGDWWTAKTWLNPNGEYSFYYGSRSYSTYPIDYIAVRLDLFCNGQWFATGFREEFDSEVAQITGTYPDGPPDDLWQALGTHWFEDYDNGRYWYPQTYDELYH